MDRGEVGGIDSTGVRMYHIVYKEGVECLTKAGIEEAALDSRLLLEYRSEERRVGKECG